MTEIATPAESDGAGDPPGRLPTLDILRGVAILGILFMNMPDMGGPMALSMGGDIRRLGWTAADRIAWWTQEVVASGTARCLLQLLFGAGMAILTDRAATALGEWRALRDYALRNIVLCLFGLIHVFVLLWPGDILHTYGLAALVAVLFRRLPPASLIALGLSFASYQLLDGTLRVAQVRQLEAAAGAVEVARMHGEPLTAAERTQAVAWRVYRIEHAQRRADLAATIAAENRDRAGSGRSWAESAWGVFLYLQGLGLERWWVWESAATMLLGAALYRLRFLTGGWRPRDYAAVTMVAYATGLTCRAGYAAAIVAGDDASWFFPLAEIARLATTLGHVGLINLLLASAAGARLLRPFDAAGKTALSIYIAQTLVCLWVLYPPWGLALYGKQGWAALMLTALAIDAALLWWANVWVRHFAIAPVEWAWRSILAGRRLPFRLSAASNPAGAIPATA